MERLNEVTGSLPPRVVAVVLNWNGMEVLASVLGSLLAQVLKPSHIIVVDNASSDESPDLVCKDFPQVQLLRNSSNLGYAGGCNAGIAEAAKHEPDFVLLLNNDVVLPAESLDRLVREAGQDRRIGILAPSVRRIDKPHLLDSAYGLFRFHQVIVDRLGESEPAEGRFAEVADVDCVFGAVLLVRPEVFARAGAFDSDFWMFLEEVEFCYRAGEAGYRIRYVPGAKAFHHGGHSTAKSGAGELRTYLVRRNSVLFMRKHGSFLRWCRFLPAAAASLLAVGASCLLHRRWRLLCARWEGYRDGFMGRRGFPRERMKTT